MGERVSIITPSFNRAYIVHETAESIFNQTYQDWEWVIVDDGSTDNSWEMLQQYAKQDSRVKIFQRNREPKGACACRNIAVENCTGDYVMFLDTDDLVAPFCLEQRVKAMNESPESDFVIFPMLLFKNEPDDMNLLWNIETGEDDLIRILKSDAICQGTGTLWKKSTFQEVGMWKEDLKLWQDVELHIRSILWPVKYTKRMDLRPDVYLRVSDDSLSRVGFYSQPKMESRISVYMDTCKALDAKELTAKYKEGLRAMGLDIIRNAIRNRCYDWADKVLDYCIEKNIFSKEEQRLFKKYESAFRMKLYRLPFLHNRLERRISDMVKVNEPTLSKIIFDSTK